MPQESETYGLHWPGRAAALREVSAAATGALVPDTKHPINAPAGTLVISENLAALRLLLPTHRGSVKMIYIDPPYNTGKADFIYEDGTRPTGRGAASAKTGSAPWLSMMYPRLALAREFLTEDGLLYVSIGDHEVHHLRMLLDEHFGAGNFEGHLHWRRRHNQPNDKTKLIGLVAEHILVYARDSAALRAAGVGKLPLTGKFSNPDDDPRGPWASKPWKVGSDQSGSPYAITSPSGAVFTEVWMGERATYERLLADGRIVFPRRGQGLPRKKYFQRERALEGQCANNWWDHELAGHNQAGNRELTALFGGVKNVFSNPKPTQLLRLLMRLARVNDGDTVMDFFAGSGSTGDAVLQLRGEGTDASFLLVQVPQAITGSNKYRRAAEEVLAPLGRDINIAELTRERLRRAAEKYAGGEGFAVLTYASES